MMKTIIALLALFAITSAAMAASSSHDTDAAKPAATMPAGHMSTAPGMAGAAEIKVPKAAGPDARTIAEIIKKRTELKNKTVVVRGQVVKVNSGILKMNWVHLRDGTGSDADGTSDLLVTTNEVVKVGEVVTIKGVVHVDKDLGMGYAYKVLVEEGKLQK